MSALLIKQAESAETQSFVRAGVHCGEIAAMASVWIEAFLCLWCCVWLFSPVMSHRCFSCRGIIDTKCESDTTDIDCPTHRNRVYDSCYTVTRVMDYPFLGRRMEVLKNCSVLAHCSFLELLMCDNSYNFVNSCSIQCCTGDMCNNKTFQYNTSSVTHGKIASTETNTSVTSLANATRTVTLATPPNNATRTPELASGINMTSSVSSIQSIVTYEGALTSWTSATSQEDIYSSASTAVIEPAVNVKAVSSDAKRIYSQMSALLLMAILGLAINYKRL